MNVKAFRCGADQDAAASRPGVAATSLPTYAAAPDYGASLLRLGLTLVVLLVGFGLAARWLRRRGPRALRSPGGRLEVVDSLRLDPKKALYLLRVDDVVELIGVSEAGIARLSSGQRKSADGALPASENFSVRLGRSASGTQAPSAEASPA